MTNSKEYRALVGINYVPSGAEEETRVEAGDKITDMTENQVRNEKAAGNLEKWVARQTDNVVDPSDPVDSQVSGVRSRHANQGEDIVLKEVDE